MGSGSAVLLWGGVCVGLEWMVQWFWIEWCLGFDFWRDLGLSLGVYFFGLFELVAFCGGTCFLRFFWWWVAVVFWLCLWVSSVVT